MDQVGDKDRVGRGDKGKPSRGIEVYAMAPDAISTTPRHRTKSSWIKASVFFAVLLLAVFGRMARSCSNPAASCAGLGRLGFDCAGGRGRRVRRGPGDQALCRRRPLQKGDGEEILISVVKPSPAEKLEIVPSHVELNCAVLLKLGVPPEAILSFGTDVSNTYEEARALAAWVKANGVRSIIVPTEIFSSRRVRWISTGNSAPLACVSKSKPCRRSSTISTIGGSTRPASSAFKTK